jgi:hypothetical protein
VDGNLLRDNITRDVALNKPEAAGAKGQSSIALLAREYVCVNPTQFLNPGPAVTASEGAPGAASEIVRYLNGGVDPLSQRFPFELAFGPVDADNTLPPYIQSGATSSTRLFFRHRSDISPTSPGNQGAAINLFVNEELTSPNPANQPNLFDFNPPNNLTSLVVPSADYVYQTFSLGDAPNSAFLFPVLGLPNRLAINYDLNPVGTGSLSQTAYRFSRIGAAPLDIASRR